jgi:hypothetical protein
VCSRRAAKGARPWGSIGLGDVNDLRQALDPMYVIAFADET